jgi:hypothetical protein
MEIWGVYTGFESNSEPAELDSLWSSEELARKYVEKEVKRQNLETWRDLYKDSIKVKASETWGLNTFGNGDYYIFITKMVIDPPYLMEL